MKKKVLIFLTSYYPDLGGAEVSVKETTDRLKEYEFHLICFPDTKNLPKFEKYGNVYIHRISGPKFLYPFTAFFKALSLEKKIGFDMIWSVMATYAGFAGLFFKLFFPKKKFLLSLQEGDSLSLMKRKAFFVYPLFIMIFRFADKIHALSSFLSSYGKSMGYKGDISIIPNGVDLKNFLKKVSKNEIEKLKQDLGKKEGDIYLITTSRLVSKNAVDDVVKALQYLPKNIYFIVLGVGKEENNLRKLASLIGVRDRVKFMGFIKHSDFPLFFSISDIFVRVSRSEGFGNSFIEAMAFGLPVLATPVGGIPDFISDNETGVFVCPDNPKDLSIKVQKLLSDREFMQKIALNGKNLATSNYSWDLISKRMDDEIFSKILK